MKEVVPAALAGERVDRVVAMLTGLPRSEVTALIEQGAVRVDGASVSTRSRRLTEGEEVEVEVPVSAAPALEPDPGVTFAVVHADDAVVVVDKPAGLVVHPGAGQAGGTLVHGLLASYPDLATVTWPDSTRPGIVHRLDKGTSGLLVVARTAAAHASLVAQLQARTVERVYLALVAGEVDGNAGVVDAPLGRSARDRTRMAVTTGGRDARTRYEVIGRGDGRTLLACRLETGRTHQIRVHLAAIGHPVVGDARYGPGRAGTSGALGRPFLHAHRLGFDHPISAARLVYESRLPSDLAAALPSAIPPQASGEVG